MTEFYDLPYVKELLEIFGNPAPPDVITEHQFDGRDRQLRTLAKTPWHEVEHGPYAEYLYDLAYVELQKELFDYLFPAFLAMWVDGLRSRINQPDAGNDFYYSIWRGRVLDKMLSRERRERVLRFITEQIASAVDLSGPEPIEPVSGMKQAQEHSFYLSVFNAVGQALPVIPELWESLSRSLSPGKARFWLVFATGLCFKPSDAPWIKERTFLKGGGGVYILSSHAEIFDQGFDRRNLEFMKATLSRGVLLDIVQRSMGAGVEAHEALRLGSCLDRIQSHAAYVDKKIGWYLENIAKPDLGGVIDDI